MKVRVKLSIAGKDIDEIVTGRDAEDVLAQAQARVARELGWKGLFVKAMSPLGFGQEAVRRYNAAHNSAYDIPQSADEFVQLGQDLGYLSLLPDDSSDAP